MASGLPEGGYITAMLEHIRPGSTIVQAYGRYSPYKEEGYEFSLLPIQQILLNSVHYPLIFVDHMASSGGSIRAFQHYARSRNIRNPLIFIGRSHLSSGSSPIGYHIIDNGDYQAVLYIPDALY